MNICSISTAAGLRYGVSVLAIAAIGSVSLASSSHALPVFSWQQPDTAAPVILAQTSRLSTQRGLNSRSITTNRLRVTPKTTNRRVILTNPSAGKLNTNQLSTSKGSSTPKGAGGSSAIGSRLGNSSLAADPRVQQLKGQSGVTSTSNRKATIGTSQRLRLNPNASASVKATKHDVPSQKTTAAKASGDAVIKGKKIHQNAKQADTTVNSSSRVPLAPTQDVSEETKSTAHKPTSIKIRLNSTASNNAANSSTKDTTGQGDRKGSANVIDQFDPQAGESPTNYLSFALHPVRTGEAEWLRTGQPHTTGEGSGGDDGWIYETSLIYATSRTTKYGKGSSLSEIFFESAEPINKIGAASESSNKNQGERRATFFTNYKPQFYIPPMANTRTDIQPNKPLLIIAEDIEGEALATLVVNKLRGGLKRDTANGGFNLHMWATLVDRDGGYVGNSGDGDRVVLTGAHLDSVNEGPGLERTAGVSPKYESSGAGRGTESPINEELNAAGFHADPGGTGEPPCPHPLDHAPGC